VYFMSNMKQIHGTMNFNFKPVFKLVVKQIFLQRLQSRKIS
jgi:hypothetical protein